jgi:hypothetical protein
MPLTPKGIYYPGPKFPPQISEDMGAMAQNVFNGIEAMQMQTYGFSPETIVAPTSYTSAAANGNGDSIDMNVGSGQSPNSGMIWFNYHGLWKKTATATTSAAIFLSVNGGTLTQLKKLNPGGAPVVQEVNDTQAFFSPGFFGQLYCNRDGLAGNAGGNADTSFATNGFVMPPGVYIYGFDNPGMSVHIEVKYKTTAGNVVLGKRYVYLGTIKAG